MTGPLQGIKVAEFSQIIAGPFAGVLLSDLGADVIKVEPPRGDPWRRPASGGPGEQRVFIAVNRGKRSITLDLTTEAGRAAVHRLAESVDVVTTNHRPDVPAKLGIDYETLSKINPRLIYCEVTAYGSKGPDSHLPGYDLVMQGYTGLISAEAKMEDGELLQVWSAPYIDLSTGHSISAAVSAALFRREKTGRGQKIELSLFANGLMLQTLTITRILDDPSPTQEWVENDLPLLREAGVPFDELLPLRMGLRSSVLFRLYYRSWRTSDYVIMVGCLSDPLRKRLMDTLGLHDPRFDPEYDTDATEYQDVLVKLIEEAGKIFLTCTSEEWIDRLRAVGVPVGPVRFPEELADNPQALANNLIVEQDDPESGRVKTVGSIYKMSETPPEAVLPTPQLGAHTDEVMQEIGFSPDEIAQLRQNGAFG